jgi:hypothetical protein
VEWVSHRNACKFASSFASFVSAGVAVFAFFARFLFFPPVGPSFFPAFSFVFGGMPLFGEREGLGGTCSLGLVRSFARFSRASGFENDENIANYRELINKYSNIFFRHCFAVPKVPGTFL